MWLMICLLAPDNIPKSYLKTFECDTMADSFIHSLREHFLITDNGDTFNIHKTIQEIGFQYIGEELSADEKKKYSDDIVRYMTQYEKIAWYLYDDQNSNTAFGDHEKTAQHLQSIMQKIHHLGQSKKKSKEYDIKLGLAFLHCCGHLKSSNFMEESAEKILHLNDVENVLKTADLAVLLEICANKCIHSGKRNSAKKYLSRCLEMCKKSKFTNCIRAVCFSDYAKLSEAEGNYAEAEKYFKEAALLLKKFPKKLQFHLQLEAGKEWQMILCRYRMAVMKYKMNDLSDAVQHIAKFITEARHLCKLLSEKNKYDELESNNAFACSTDPTQIHKYFKNSEKILQSVFNASHQFLKDLIYKVD
jgi:tetratricopeptide (TPR) repeat protein